MKILNLFKKVALCIHLLTVAVTVNGASSGASAGAGCDEERGLSSIIRHHTQRSLIAEINMIIESSDVDTTVKKAKKITLWKHAEITSKFYDKIINHYFLHIFRKKSVKTSQYYFYESIREFNEFIRMIHTSEQDDLQFRKYKELKKDILIRLFDVKTVIRRHFSLIYKNPFNDKYYDDTQESTSSLQIKYIFEDLLEIFI